MEGGVRGRRKEDRRREKGGEGWRFEGAVRVRWGSKEGDVREKRGRDEGGVR